MFYKIKSLNQIYKLNSEHNYLQWRGELFLRKWPITFLTPTGLIFSLVGCIFQIKYFNKNNSYNCTDTINNNNSDHLLQITCPLSTCIWLYRITQKLIASKKYLRHVTIQARWYRPMVGLA